MYFPPSTTTPLNGTLGVLNELIPHARQIAQTHALIMRGIARDTSPIVRMGQNMLASGARLVGSRYAVPDTPQTLQLQTELIDSYLQTLRTITDAAHNYRRANMTLSTKPNHPAVAQGLRSLDARLTQTTSRAQLLQKQAQDYRTMLVHVVMPYYVIGIAQVHMNELERNLNQMTHYGANVVGDVEAYVRSI